MDIPENIVTIPCKVCIANNFELWIQALEPVPGEMMARQCWVPRALITEIVREPKYAKIVAIRLPFMVARNRRLV